MCVFLLQLLSFKFWWYIAAQYFHCCTSLTHLFHIVQLFPSSFRGFLLVSSIWFLNSSPILSYFFFCYLNFFWLYFFYNIVTGRQKKKKKKKETNQKFVHIFYLSNSWNCCGNFPNVFFFCFVETTKKIHRSL